MLFARAGAAQVKHHLALRNHAGAHLDKVNACLYPRYLQSHRRFFSAVRYTYQKQGATTGNEEENH